jgi:ketopantoate reductase
MSLNDMAAELTIMILQNAQSIKAIEREMKAELAAVQFQNGMKMADMIEKRGELAFQKAVTEAVTKMTSAVASIAAQKIGEKLATPKTTQGEGRSQLGLGQGDGSKFIPGQKSQLTEAQKMAVQSTGKMCNDLAKAMVEATGTLIAAHLDLDISKIDAEKQVMETMNKLIDSVISSVDSSIRSQDSAISFAMNLLQQLNSLAADGCNKIINNMR